MRTKYSLAKLVGIFALIILVVGLLSAIFLRQNIKDYYVVSTTDLSADALSLKESLSLTDRGKFLFEASQTSLEDRGLFNDSCKGVVEQHEVVLGCYTNQRIYIFNVSDERLDGANQVTAAHELLHAVYERLSSSQRSRINTLLDKQLGSINDQDLQATLNQYKQADRATFLNEAHSIIGTELRDIEPELREHYDKYFTDRAKVVDYSEKYKSVFHANQQKIDQYDASLAKLKTDKENLEATLTNQQASLEQQSAQMAVLRSSNTSAYNQMVPSYNQLVRSYNANIDELKKIIEDYNSLVNNRNQLATTQNDLIENLSNHYQPIN